MVNLRRFEAAQEKIIIRCAAKQELRVNYVKPPCRLQQPCSTTEQAELPPPARKSAQAGETGPRKRVLIVLGGPVVGPLSEES